MHLAWTTNGPTLHITHEDYVYSFFNRTLVPTPQEVAWTCKKVFQFLYDHNFNTTFDFQVVLYSYAAIKSP